MGVGFGFVVGLGGLVIVDESGCSGLIEIIRD